MVFDVHKKLKWLPTRHYHKGGKTYCFNRKNEVTKANMLATAGPFLSGLPLTQNVPLLVVLDSKAQGGSKNSYCMSCKRAKRETERETEICKTSHFGL